MTQLQKIERMLEQYRTCRSATSLLEDQLFERDQSILNQLKALRLWLRFRLTRPEKIFQLISTLPLTTKEIDFVLQKPGEQDCEWNEEHLLEQKAPSVDELTRCQKLWTTRLKEVIESRLVATLLPVALGEYYAKVYPSWVLASQQIQGVSQEQRDEWIQAMTRKWFKDKFFPFVNLGDFKVSPLQPRPSQQTVPIRPNVTVSVPAPVSLPSESMSSSVLRAQKLFRELKKEGKHPTPTLSQELSNLANQFNRKISEELKENPTISYSDFVLDTLQELARITNQSSLNNLLEPLRFSNAARERANQFRQSVQELKNKEKIDLQRRKEEQLEKEREEKEAREVDSELDKLKRDRNKNLLDLLERQIKRLTEAFIVNPEECKKGQDFLDFMLNILTEKEGDTQTLVLPRILKAPLLTFQELLHEHCGVEPEFSTEEFEMQ